MENLKEPRTKNRDGFTLIEVLIVVVIIGVLAALIIPRMVGQPGKAKMAEAFHMIGALRRGEQAYMDLNGISAASTTPYLSMNTWASPANFSKLGMQTPGNATYEYSCYNDVGWATGTCCAMLKPTDTANWWVAPNSYMCFTENNLWKCSGSSYTCPDQSMSCTVPCVAK